MPASEWPCAGGAHAGPARGSGERRTIIAPGRRALASQQGGAKQGQIALRLIASAQRLTFGRQARQRPPRPSRARSSSLSRMPQAVRHVCGCAPAVHRVTATGALTNRCAKTATSSPPRRFSGIGSLQEQIAAEQRTAMRNRHALFEQVAFGQLTRRSAGHRRRQAQALATIRVDRNLRAEQHSRGRMFCQQRAQIRQRARQQLVVSVEQQRITPARRANPVIACRCSTGIGLIEQPQLRMASGVTARTSAVASVDPSSTTISSTSAAICRAPKRALAVTDARSCRSE
jgi:hypothetical protein